MRPNAGMTEIIARVRYSVDKATLLAHNEYWDGHNQERSGRNTFLYLTPKGRFFEVVVSQWQGERDRIMPLDRDSAYDLYERLPEKEVSAESAFPGIEIEEA
jgi:hypothetical protein